MNEDPFGSGWIKLYRKTLEKGYYRESHYVHLWIHCLLKANHKEKEILVNGKSMTIKRGQFLTSRRKLSSETGIQESKIERILKFLKTEQQIEQQGFSSCRLISITNYDKYQIREQQIEQQVNSKRTASEHKQEYKNDKNERNTHGHTKFIHDFEEFWKCYPKKKHKEKAYNAYLEAVKECNPQTLLKALAGYMNYKDDEARRTGQDLDPKYFKNPENFLVEGVWKDYVNYEPEGPQL